MAKPRLTCLRKTPHFVGEDIPSPCFPPPLKPIPTASLDHFYSLVSTHEPFPYAAMRPGEYPFSPMCSTGLPNMHRRVRWVPLSVKKSPDRERNIPLRPNFLQDDWSLCLNTCLYKSPYFFHFRIYSTEPPNTALAWFFASPLPSPSNPPRSK